MSRITVGKQRANAWRAEAQRRRKEAARLERLAREERKEAARLDENASALDPGTRTPAMKAVMLDRQCIAVALRKKNWTMEQIGELFGVERNAVFKMLNYSIRVGGEIAPRKR
jgi:hypothetical protein